MPAFAPLTVNDREATPVAHTFNPNGFSGDNSVAFFKNEGVTAIEDEKFSVSVRESATNRKVRCKLELPTVVTETINGVNIPKVARVAYADLTFTVARTSSEQERKNLVGILANMLAVATADVDDVIVGQEAIW